MRSYNITVDLQFTFCLHRPSPIFYCIDSQHLLMHRLPKSFIAKTPKIFYCIDSQNLLMHRPTKSSIAQTSKIYFAFIKPENLQGAI